jgi:hypothetical protein
LIETEPPVLPAALLGEHRIDQPGAEQIDLFGGLGHGDEIGG